MLCLPAPQLRASALRRSWMLPARCGLACTPRSRQPAFPGCRFSCPTWQRFLPRPLHSLSPPAQVPPLTEEEVNGATAKFSLTEGDKGYEWTLEVSGAFRFSGRRREWLPHCSRQRASANNPVHGAGMAGTALPTSP